jgi:hypothetical protein
MPAMSTRDRYPDVDPAKLLFAIVPVVSPPSNAILHGSLSAVLGGIQDSDLLKQTRNDAVTAMNDAVTKMAKADQREEELTRRDAALSAREALLNDATRRICDFAGRMGTLFDRLEQRRADAEKFGEPISAPPGDIRPGTPGSDDLLPPHITPAVEEPELEDPATEDGELPPDLAKLQPKDPPEPPGTVYPSPLRFH